MMWPEEIRALHGDTLIDQFARGLGNAHRYTKALAGIFTGGRQPRSRIPPPGELAALRERAKQDLWNVKGFVAYGAQDAGDRLDAMDRMGVARQLVFPTLMYGAQMSDLPEAFAACSRYNDTILEWARAGQGRLRPACIINQNDVGLAVAEAERVIARGAHALLFPVSAPPAGRSPAHPDWDRLYAPMAEAGVPGLYHIGGQFGFFDPQWGDTPTLRPVAQEAGDPGEPFGPVERVVGHVPVEVAMTAKVLGGVFERHPRLRWGVIEFGAAWVPLWLEQMARSAHQFRGRLSLSLSPAEYVRRQVRITPFYGEPVGELIQRTGAPEVFAFSTDYPHPEGGRDPIQRFHASVERLGERVVEQFFVHSGNDLLPA
jgi:predicted TIM-barrel fold metal-dependent hydrolase